MIADAKTLDTLALVNKEVARVDSRLLASSLHKPHKVLMALIHKYVDRLRAASAISGQLSSIAIALGEVCK